MTQVHWWIDDQVSPVAWIHPKKSTDPFIFKSGLDQNHWLSLDIVDIVSNWKKKKFKKISKEITWNHSLPKFKYSHFLQCINLHKIVILGYINIILPTSDICCNKFKSKNFIGRQTTFIDFTSKRKKYFSSSCYLLSAH